MRVPRAYTSCGPLTAPTNRHLTGNVNSGFAPGTLPTTDANIASSRVIIVSYSCILGTARPRKGARPLPSKRSLRQSRCRSTASYPWPRPSWVRANCTNKIGTRRDTFGRCLGVPSAGAPPSTRPTDPTEQGGAHRLMQIEVLGTRGALQFIPERRGQSHRADDARPPPSLAGMAASEQHGVGRELRHFPKCQEGGTTRLAGTGEGVTPHRPEAGKVDRTVERISHFRSASSHAWWPFVR